MDMIGKVAKALLISQPSDDLSWAQARVMAYEAIAAMREPTPEMERAGECEENAMPAGAVWKAMIDAALQA